MYFFRLPAATINLYNPADHPDLAGETPRGHRRDGQLILRIEGSVIGQRKASMLEPNENLNTKKQLSITEGIGTFAHRRLPMGKKNPPPADCVLRASVVKNVTVTILL
jgi:hypothetical protein